EEVRGAAADVQGALDEIARFQDSLRVDRADDDIDCVLLESLELSELRDRYQLPVDEKRVEPLALGPAAHIGVKSFSRFHERRQDFQRSAFHCRLELTDDRRNTLLFDRQIAIGTKLRPRFREQEA